MQRLLAPDVAGHGFMKAFEYSNYALAGLTPVAALSSKGSLVQKTADLGLGVAIPLHMHFTTNAVVSDYVPKAYRLPVRGLVLGCSIITYLGIMKMNMAGPGLTETIRLLWSKTPREATVKK